MIYLIAVGAFVVVLIVFALYVRKSTLNQLELLPDEKIIQQTDQKYIYSKGLGPNPTGFPNCRVLFTSHRIIVAQKILFKKDHQIHYFIWLKPGNESIKKGILNLTFVKENLEINKDAIVLKFDGGFIKKLKFTKPGSELTRAFEQLLLK